MSVGSCPRHKNCQHYRYDVNTLSLFSRNYAQVPPRCQHWPLQLELLRPMKTAHSFGVCRYCWTESRAFSFIAKPNGIGRDPIDSWIESGAVYMV